MTRSKSSSQSWFLLRMWHRWESFENAHLSWLIFRLDMIHEMKSNHKHPLHLSTKSSTQRPWQETSRTSWAFFITVWKWGPITNALMDTKIIQTSSKNSRNMITSTWKTQIHHGNWSPKKNIQTNPRADNASTILQRLKKEVKSERLWIKIEKMRSRGKD